jgi:hypothetical protein
MSFARLCLMTAVVAAVSVVLSTPAVFAAPAADDGFVEMFNGKNLDGWVVEGTKDFQRQGERKPVWTAEKGTIVCAGSGFGFLRYDKKLGDFIVHVEYRLAKRCNSGLGIRSVKYRGSAASRPSFAAYEIQLLDDAGKKPNEYSSGSLYRYVAPKVNSTRPAGEWNTIDIECRGPKIRITQNGQVLHDLDQTTIEAIKTKPLTGYFALQDHGGKIEFRNLRVKELH